MNLFSLLYLEFLKFLFLSFCILLVIPASEVPVHLPRFSISKIPSVWVFFIASIQFLSSKPFELFVDCFFFFSFVVYFKGFIDFLQFSLCLFLSFFKGLYHLHKVILRPFLFVSLVLDCSDLADVGSLIFRDAILFFVLLNVFLHCCLPISSSRCMVRDMDLFLFFYRLTSGFASTICWRCSLFSIVYF